MASGFHDTLGYLKPVGKEQASLVDEWLDLLELQRSGTLIFETTSPTIQRIILLTRAMIKNPPLLILDEPCQGLDHAQQTRVRTVVDAICSASAMALIYVTHYEEELPTCVDHVLQIENGKRIK